MRYVQIPQTIEVTPPQHVLEQDPNAKPEKMTFLRFASQMWFDDHRAIEGGFAKQVRWADVVG